MPSRDALPGSVKLAYGAPAFAGAAMVVTTGVHAPRFYSDVILAPLGVIAFVVAIARAFDAITDPVMGWLSDRTRTRWGRRRPYIFAGSVPLALSFWLFFSPPANLADVYTSVWLGVIFCLLFLFSTITAIPAQALGAELSLDYHERSAVFGIRSGFAAAGTIAGAVMPGVLQDGFGIDDERWIFSVLAGAYGLILVVLNGIMVARVRERPEFGRRPPNPFIPGIRRALRNRPFRILLLAGTINAIPASIPAILMPYYTYYAIRPAQPASWLATFLLLYLGAGFVCLPIWIRIARRWGKVRTMVTASTMGISGSVLFFFAGQGETGFAAAVYLYTGIASGAFLFLIPAMGADTIDYDELRTGRRREAQFGAFWAIIPKFVSIPGGAIPIAILSAVGYVPNVDQTPEVVFTIKFLYSIFPAAFYVVALLVVMRYPISEAVHRAIREGVAAHEGGRPATDPLTGERLPSPHAGDGDDWFLDYFGARELERALRDGGARLRGDVWRQIAAAACVLGLAVAVAAASVAGAGVEPGPGAVLAVVVAGGALTALCFHLGRLAAARRFPGRTDAERIRLHLSVLRGGGDTERVV